MKLTLIDQLPSLHTLCVLCLNYIYLRFVMQRTNTGSDSDTPYSNHGVLSASTAALLPQQSRDKSFNDSGAKITGSHRKSVDSRVTYLDLPRDAREVVYQLLFTFYLTNHFFRLDGNLIEFEMSLFLLVASWEELIRNCILLLCVPIAALKG